MRRLLTESWNQWKQVGGEREELSATLSIREAVLFLVRGAIISIVLTGYQVMGDTSHKKWHTRTFKYAERKEKTPFESDNHVVVSGSNLMFNSLKHKQICLLKLENWGNLVVLHPLNCLLVRGK